jgi:ribonuclease Z
VKILLLGTGTPAPDLRRLPSSTLIETPIGAWLVDCGDGAVVQLLRAGIKLDSIGYLIFTHLHTDHTLDYVPFVSGGHYGKRSSLHVWGPERFLAMHRMLADFYRDDGGSDTGLDRAQVAAYRGGIVFEEQRLTVDALPVQHSQETYALRFRAAGQTIVHSADTAYHEPLIEFASGADVLIHNAMCAEAMRATLGQRWEIIHEIMATPAEAGRVARLAGVKKLVLVHLWPDVDAEQVRRECATEYDGEIIVGADLMRFECDP